jgi:hypothetical protein
VLPIKKLQRQERWMDENGSPVPKFAEIIEAIVEEVNNMTANVQLFKVNPAGTSPSAGGEYTAKAMNKGGRGTVIKQFIATGSTGTYDVYIGDAATAANKVINGASPSVSGDTATSLIDQVIAPDETIWVVPSSGGAIVFMASGTELE